LPPRKALNESAANERARHFLKVLIERYIHEGHPIGSRTLARDAGLDLSPATIRNVMADLEEMGLVVSPHTSAGRVPTVSGYRVFLDSLLTLKPLGEREVESIRAQLDGTNEPGTLISSASQLLSGVTHMAGVVRLPKRERASFRQIEFLRLSGTRVLAILVTNEEAVINRIIHTKRVYSESELQQAANYLNAKFAGHGLRAVRTELVQEMREAREHMDRIMARALEMAGQVVAGSDEDGDYLIAGQTNLMDFDELASMDRLKHLFQDFTEKQQILHLLDHCMDADGVQIFIGGESDYRIFDGCSMVTAPYKVEDRVVGVLGVIGPTRMAYERVIPIVDVTARLLGAALKPR
jgi:heat-inducible transcriptional repressor